MGSSETNKWHTQHKELRDAIKQHGLVIDLDETRGDFTFIEATKI
jgi:hypothetical protein